MQPMSIVSDIAGRLDMTRLAAAKAALGAVVLSAVYASQHLGGLRPCALCLYQRWPWWVALGLAVLAMALRGHAKLQMAVIGLASMSLLVGAGIAVFHVGVEQHWWQGLASCGGVHSCLILAMREARASMRAPCTSPTTYMPPRTASLRRPCSTTRSRRAYSISRPLGIYSDTYDS